MRNKDEILAKIKRVNTAKRNAERKRKRCIERLKELNAELKEAEDNEED